MSSILVGSDFSGCARTGLDLAAALAARWQARLFPLHVFDPLMAGGPLLPISATGRREQDRSVAVQVVRCSSRPVLVIRAPGAFRLERGNPA